MPQFHRAVSPNPEQRISKGLRFLFHVSSEWGMAQGLDEPPKRRLPPWSSSPPKVQLPKPVYRPPRSNYPYKAKLPDSDYYGPVKIIPPPPAAKEARGLVTKEPDTQPIQSSKTSPSSQPEAYSKPTEVTNVIQGASTKPMDMFHLEIHENQPVNQITSFLRTLALLDHTPVQTSSEDLFSSFEEIYSTQPSNPQPPRESSNEPMVEDLSEPTQIPNPSAPAPPTSNHAHDNHLGWRAPRMQRPETVHGSKEEVPPPRGLWDRFPTGRTVQQMMDTMDMIIEDPLAYNGAWLSPLPSENGGYNRGT
ncbi:hypothetical protein LguiB_013140 [Lonicera macranthoides]